MDQSKDPQEDPVPPVYNSISSSIKGTVCRDVEADWNEKTKRKRNRQGKDPTTSKETSQGRDPRTLETTRERLRVPHRLVIKVAGSR